MNKTIMTRAEILADYAECRDLGQLIRKMEETLTAQGQVICQFRLNGLSLSEADEKRLAGIDLQDVEMIEVDSESPIALLFGLMENWVLELPKLLENTEALAKLIRFEGIEGHLKPFVELVESCQFLLDSLMSLEKVIQGVEVATPNWQKAQELTAAGIGEALRQFENKDFVLLAEILEYDLAHALQVWLDEIQHLSRALREENAKNPTQFSERVFSHKS